MTPQDRQGLAAARLFQDLAPGEVAAILDRSEILRTRRREPLFRQGEAARGLYLVAAGRFKLTRLGGDGREVVLRFLGPGDAVATGPGCTPTQLPPVTATALADGRVAFWPGPLLTEICGESPRLAGNLEREAAERAEEASSRVREVAALPAPQRVAHLLLRLARQAGLRDSNGIRIDFPLSRQDLAEMTGTTLFTASRLLSEWATAGLIEIGRGRVVVRSPAGLAGIAGDGNE